MPHNSHHHVANTTSNKMTYYATTQQNEKNKKNTGLLRTIRSESKIKNGGSRLHNTESLSQTC